MKKPGHQKALKRAVLALASGFLLTSSVHAAEIGVVTGNVVNIRKGPGTDYESIKQFTAGRQLTVLGTENGWYHIQWEDSDGYVLGEYLSLIGDEASTGEATVTGGNAINVRSGPGTDRSRVAVVSAGKHVSVLGMDGDWYCVSFDETIGYIRSDFILLDEGNEESEAGDVDENAARTDDQLPPGAVAPVAVSQIIEELPAIDPAMGEGVHQISGNATVANGKAVNLRAGPGTNFAKITSLPSGSRVTLLEEKDGWFRLISGDVSGYMLGEYLIPDAGALASISSVPTLAGESGKAPVVPLDGEGLETGVVIGGTINVRTGPGTAYDRVGQVHTGNRLSILGREDDWIQVSFNGMKGYILDKYVAQGDAALADPVLSLVIPAGISTGSDTGSQVVFAAMQYLGVRYLYGGDKPSGFDCSGLTMYVYQKFGYSLPHSASEQYECGTRVLRSELMPGDLVFFSSSGGTGRITHVGIYIGNDQIIHARYGIGMVHVNSLSEPYYSANYVGAVRII